MLQSHVQDDNFITSFQKAKPFRHLVVDDLLVAQFCGELADEFPSFHADNAISELGTSGRKAVHTDVPSLGPAYESFDALIRSKEFLNLMSRWTGIPNLLYDPEYIGGGTHENCDGQELDPHIDFNYHPTTALHRRLNLILFLNREWKDRWGGVLDFHCDPWDPDRDQVHSISPRFNRCVIFETNENSWHGFCRIHLPENKRDVSRRSIAVYFYTKERPIAEVESVHSTIYVPRPMPTCIQPGYTLDETDHRDLKTSYMRNMHQIRFLYDQISNSFRNQDDSVTSEKTLLAEVVRMRQKLARLSQQMGRQEDEIELRKKVLAKVESSASFRIGRLMTWPFRVLRRLKCTDDS